MSARAWMDRRAQRSDDFSRVFEAAFARLQVRLEMAYAGRSAWTQRVVAAVREALEFAAELPALHAELVQFVLTPYIGTEEARRLAAAAGWPSSQPDR